MKYLKYVLPVAVIIIIVVALASYAYVSGEEENLENQLSVDATYLVKNNETASSVNVSANIYLTNVDANSGDVRIVTYLMDSYRGIAVDTQEIQVGQLEQDTTSNITLYMEMGNHTYDLEVLIFEDDLLKIKGNGEVRVHPFPAEDSAGGWEVTLDSQLHYKDVRP